MNFNAQVSVPAPKADFQYWSTTWQASNFSYPNPILILPTTYYRRKFWWGVRFTNSAQRNSSGLSFEWVFSGQKLGNPFERTFRCEYLRSIKGRNGDYIEGMAYAWPFVITVNGMENQHEPFIFRDKLGGVAHSFSSVPNFFLGEFSTLSIRPTKNATWSGPFFDATGTNTLSIFAAVYSEQPVERR